MIHYLGFIILIVPPFSPSSSFLHIYLYCLPDICACLQRDGGTHRLMVDQAATKEEEKTVSESDADATAEGITLA